MDFGNLKGFDMGFSQPSNPIPKIETKPTSTVPVFSFNQNPASKSSPSDQNNPFADIESGFSPILQPPPIKATTPFNK